MDNKKLFMAALLSVGVLILWQTIFPAAPPPESEAPRLVESSVQPARGSEAQTRSSGSSSGAALDAERLEEGRSVGGAEEIGAEVVAEVAAETEREVVLESDRFRATFSNRGAQLLSFELTEHESQPGESVDLVRRRIGYPYPFAVFDSTGASDSLNEALFSVAEGAAADDAYRFEYSGPLGRATKEFWLRPDGMLGVRISVPGRTDWSVLLGPGLRNPDSEEIENRFARRAVVYLKEGEVERKAAQKADENEQVSGQQLLWIGLEDNYFLASWVATESPIAYSVLRPISGRTSGEGAETAFEPVALASEEEGVVREFELLLAPGSDLLEGAAFLGAKQFNQLGELPNQLQEAVNLGFFAILAKPILLGLRWLHDTVTSNWGWAIILMTVFIRLLLFPLTHKSFVSMQKMQEVNPKIQSIRNKYRGKLKDKQGRPNTEAQRKMNEEVMGLYKKEGVNPAGGCLPMLLQIPVLFAFYNLLSAAVELRHAPWIMWIHDLSAPDPYYALPIIMGASQFIQQRLTPSAADPMQRRMFMLMPFFFTILFLGFPSGMVLYWLTNNILGIVQQASYQKLKERKKLAAEAEGSREKSSNQK